MLLESEFLKLFSLSCPWHCFYWCYCNPQRSLPQCWAASRCAVLHNLCSDVQRTEKTRNRGFRGNFRLMLNMTNDHIALLFFSWPHGKQHCEKVWEDIFHAYMPYIYLNVYSCMHVHMNIIHTYLYAQISKYVISIVIFSTVQKNHTYKCIWQSFPKWFLKKYLKENGKQASGNCLWKALIQYSVDTVMNNRYLWSGKSGS